MKNWKNVCFFVRYIMWVVFSPFGEVVSAKVMVDSICGESLGYGFVRYADENQAQHAVECMNDSKVLWLFFFLIFRL
jgi:RNA recognition motif-containing protein